MAPTHTSTQSYFFCKMGPSKLRSLLGKYDKYLEPHRIHDRHDSDRILANTNPLFGFLENNSKLLELARVKKEELVYNLRRFRFEKGPCLILVVGIGSNGLPDPIFYSHDRDPFRECKIYQISHWKYVCYIPFVYQPIPATHNIHYITMTDVLKYSKATRIQISNIVVGKLILSSCSSFGNILHFWGLTWLLKPRYVVSLAVVLSIILTSLIFIMLSSASDIQPNLFIFNLLDLTFSSAFQSSSEKQNIFSYFFVPLCFVALSISLTSLFCSFIGFFSLGKMSRRHEWIQGNFSSFFVDKQWTSSGTLTLFEKTLPSPLALKNDFALVNKIRYGLMGIVFTSLTIILSVLSILK